jgi:hypothetical protein
MYAWLGKTTGSDSGLLQKRALYTCTSRGGGYSLLYNCWSRARICHSSCIVLCQYSHPPTYVTSIYVVHPILSILSQERKFINTKLKMFPRCWTPWSGIHGQRSCWNSEANHFRWSWTTWVWAWGEDREGFERDWGTWTDWSWHQRVSGHWFEQTTSNTLATNYEDACLLWGDFGGQDFWLARIQCLISSSHLQWHGNRA